MIAVCPALVRLLERVDPVKRRLWTARILVGSLVGWAGSHIGLLVLPPWFFEHVLLAISWLAITATAADMLMTTDVRATTDPEGPPP